MNKNLQIILDIVQQSNAFNDEGKNSVIKALKEADKEIEITAFKLERTEKVKKTTAILLEETIEELEQKRKAVEAQNRELEIEASLEKVRTIAMGMRKPEDMLEVCKSISVQLESLGVKEVRNVQTAIFREQYGTYMNYEFYSKHNKTIITETTYTNHEVHNEFAIKMLKGKGETFITHIKGDEVKDWIEYQKTTNVFIDKYLETASSLNYYWFSLGPVALGISTYHPLMEEEINLFKRFLKVFELAYQRYLDIEKAEAQAREAQIEAALEKVRSRSMAMHNPADLSAVVFEMFTALIKLDAKLDRCIILIVDPKTLGINWYLSGKEGLLSNNGFYVQNNTHLSHQAYLEGWRTKRKKWQYNLSGEEKKRWDAFGFSETELLQLPDFIKADMSAVESIHLTISSDDFGCLIASSLSPLLEAHAGIVDRFTTVFNQTYTRFLDLQKAEAQNKIIQAENERKTRELEEARELQLAMLPNEIPNLKDFEIAVFMKTATEVGGDYYDFSFMNNGSLNIAIGDATGHGMKAGTMVTMIKSLFMVNSSSKEMPEFFRLTNEAIKNSNLKRMMVGFAMMNIYGKKLKVINAGMPPVYYYKNSLREIIEIGGHNLPLGALSKTKYRADELDMEQGDSVLMLSDGFPELQNDKNEPYGYKKLVDTFLQAGSRSASEIIDALRCEVKDWGCKKELEDDITFVVVKVK